jgi:two-component system OmpR family response regulator
MTPTTVSVQPPALARSGGIEVAPLDFPPLRVLCVDDNPDAADTLGVLLSMIGFVPEVCHDAATALALAERFQPEACILDITMPDMDGCELAKALRSRDGGRDLLLLAVTAHGDRETQKRTTAAGFDRHLTKPVMPQELVDALFEFERRLRTR